ncbi:MAG: Stp1/IreP family PP2C-type Ser/Thr phosphatase [Blastocatellia bacterium]|nr:Stp1/IreP family PP2C-type Ser/Thr phosphatase [Blastocatellia bacterium]
MVRAGNEDTFLVVNLDTSDTWTPVTVEDEPPAHLSSFEQSSHGTVLAVSDGMGGALAGEVASRMAVDGVRHHMLHFQSSGTFASFPFHEQLRLAVEQANSQINNESMSNADYAGMGATFTAAGVDNGVLTIAQIGDSRCYLIRNGRIALVTHDQSLVWQLVEAGHITEEEAETHQYKNVILQALGAQPRINVVVDRIPLNHGDTVLLCSDGLSGRVRAEEMLDIVTKGSTLREACEALIQLANDRGGEDNITVVLAQFDGEDLPPPGEMLSERIERDPNLPYEIDLLADSGTHAESGRSAGRCRAGAGLG